MPLSERQINAAHRLGQDVCVVAGPGSGKTSVLIERFSWLVTRQGISPQRILAITFTEKAATEIRERMVRVFAGAPAIREQIERAYVSTIHSFCARILRENAIEAGIDPAFTVLDRSLPLLREVADEVLESLYASEPHRMRRFLRSLAVATDRDGYVPDLATSLIQIYEALRLAGTQLSVLRDPVPFPAGGVSRLLEIAALIRADRPAIRTDKQQEQHAASLEWCEALLAVSDVETASEMLSLVCRKDLNMNSLAKGSAARETEVELRGLCEDVRRSLLLRHYTAERDLIAEAVTRIDEMYRARKRAQSALDFDDLEESAIRLLEADDALRSAIAARFDYILMDELQDTNPLQWRLMRLVRREGNFFAVGDVNQSIYGFRHAQPELFQAYRTAIELAGLPVDELRDSYRTRPEVLDVINRVFVGAPGVEAHTLTAALEFPPHPAPSVEVIVAFGDTVADTERTEALNIAARISELVNSEGVRYGDIAILTRANYSTGELQRALDAFAIPSVVLGGMTFYDTREVRDLKLLLDVLVNPRNEIALAGLLRSPVFGLSDEEIFRLTSVYGSLHSAIAANPPEYWSTIEELRRIRNTISPELLLQRVIDECDYESGLTSRARANVEKFMAALRERHRQNPAPLREVVADLEDAAPEAEAPPREFANAVRLMTLHKAKGLEFRLVFLPYLHKGRGSGFPTISWSHEHGLGVKWRNPVTNAGEGDPVWQRNRAAAQLTQEAEENRLLYVGMTRAKEHLVLSWSCTGRERGSWPGLLSSTLGIDVSERSNAAIDHDGVRIVRTMEQPEVQPGAVAGDHESSDLVLDRLPIGDLSDSSASVTDISRFAECPRKYYLSRYLRQESSRRRNAPLHDDDFLEKAHQVNASELGRQVHAILAGAPVEQPSPEAVEFADRFFTSALGKRAARAQGKQHEWDFLMEAADLVLRGQVDLWFEHNRELVIVDYKTDREIDAQALTGYSLQVQLYAIALERWLGRFPDRGILYFLRADREYEVDLTPLALGAALDTVREFRNAQARLSFPLQTGEHCRACEFFPRLCPADSSGSAGRL